MNRALRLLAGTLVLALPLGAAAGCGAEKKKTVKQEFSTAQDHLADSKSASFTLRFGDAAGNLAKAMTKDGDVPPAVVQALLKGSVTYVTDPAGDATLRSVQSKGASQADVKAAFSKVNLSFRVRDDQDDLAELRVVKGDLFAHINLNEIGRLAKAGGVDDFDATLDENLGASDPRMAQALTDVRAGKWLKLPLSKYLDQLQGLAEGFPGASPGASPGYDLSGLGSRALAAVKPYVKVTDANDSSKDRVLDVKVQARPALKALLAVLKTEKGLPFSGMLGDAESEIDKNVKDGVAKGRITLHESHLTQVSVDLESIRQLSNDPGNDSFAGVQVVVDVDDDADELQTPSDVSKVDLAALVEQLIGGFFGMGMQGSTSPGSFSG
ncbi:MAG TPA: hypothetical protein VMZ11_00905 [Mycobacteriales bacterium]|nr:hypothetical protein [Mycobacteriales bacterium]